MPLAFSFYICMGKSNILFLVLFNLKLIKDNVIQNSNLKQQFLKMRPTTIIIEIEGINSQPVLLCVDFAGVNFDLKLNHFTLKNRLVWENKLSDVYFIKIQIFSTSADIIYFSLKWQIMVTTEKIKKMYSYHRE